VDLFAVNWLIILKQIFKSEDFYFLSFLEGGLKLALLIFAIDVEETARHGELVDKVLSLSLPSRQELLVL
jgi:hypothetical protein